MVGTVRLSPCLRAVLRSKLPGATSQTCRRPVALGEGEVGEWFEKIYNHAKVAVQSAYTAKSGSKEFGHRNWMRSATTEAQIKTSLESLFEFSGGQRLAPSPKPGR